MQSEHWLKAMDTESLALIKNGTWTLVDLPPKVKLVGVNGFIKSNTIQMEP